MKKFNPSRHTPSKGSRKRSSHKVYTLPLATMAASLTAEQPTQAASLSRLFKRPQFLHQHTLKQLKNLRIAQALQQLKDLRIAQALHQLISLRMARLLSIKIVKLMWLLTIQNGLKLLVFLSSSVIVLLMMKVKIKRHLIPTIMVAMSIIL